MIEDSLPVLPEGAEPNIIFRPVFGLGMCASFSDSISEHNKAGEPPYNCHQDFDSGHKGNPMKIQKDTKGQLYIQWQQADNKCKRAWIQHRSGEKDWANTRRYLNVVRCNKTGNPAGNPTDFPIFNDLPDE